jgi:hypothetical protein
MKILILGFPHLATFMLIHGMSYKSSSVDPGITSSEYAKRLPKVVLDPN